MISQLDCETVNFRGFAEPASMVYESPLLTIPKAALAAFAHKAMEERSRVLGNMMCVIVADFRRRSLRQTRSLNLFPPFMN